MPKTQSKPQSEWSVRSLPLPEEVSNAERQFSGMAIYNNRLYLLPECRLQEQHEPVIFSTALKTLDNYLNGDPQKIIFQKHPIKGLENIVEKIASQGEIYEGLEAMTVAGDHVYFSVETDTKSNDCFVIKGQLNAGEVQLDTTNLLAIAKPFDRSGLHVYNAGFEAIVFHKKRLYCFFEYNMFLNGNYVYHFNSTLSPESKDSILIEPVPFRITDIAMTGRKTATAINFFYQGGGEDTVYRPLVSDAVNYGMVHDSVAGYKSFARLLPLRFKRKKISYEAMPVIPDAYRAYNWEGIVPYKNGFILINDKYTPAKPYRTLLVFISPQ